MPDLLCCSRSVRIHHACAAIAALMSMHCASATLDIEPSGDAGPPADRDGAPEAPDVPQLAPCMETVWRSLIEVDDALFEDELRARREFLATPIAVRGRVVDELGEAIAGATVAIPECDIVVQSGADGSFAIDALGRHNRTLDIRAPGHRDEVTHVQLFHPVAVTEVAMDSIELVAEDPDTVRFLFGGDVAFVRRFLDPHERTPRDAVPFPDPAALIQVDDPLPGTRLAMSHVRPHFLRVDFPVVNFESVVTRDPTTPHRDKRYAFFSLPESLGVFDWLNVRYISLGNNHLYDYLEQGVVDTIAHVEAAGLAHSGAGRNQAEAMEPHVVSLGGAEYALLSMTSVAGSHAPPLFVATDDKGGAADMRDDEEVTAAVEAVRARDQVAIVQAHLGQEYTYTISDYGFERMSVAAQAGASLVVGHHPHIAQGFSFLGSTLLIHSLGNLCFDQERMETMLGLMAQVDMDGDLVERAAGLPVYLEDFRPRMAVGRMAEVLLRRVGRSSSDRGGISYSWAGRARVARSGEELVRSSRTVRIPVTVDDSGQAIVDLREHAAVRESLVGVQMDGSDFTLQLGEDLLSQVGHFEDDDIDGDLMEAERWILDEPDAFHCLDDPYQGAAAACIRRDDDHTVTGVLELRNRVRVLGNAIGAPNKDLSYIAYMKARNTGPFFVTTRFFASEGDGEFGDELLVHEEGGSFPWRVFSGNINMPADLGELFDMEANPRALRLFFHLWRPDLGSGVLAVDGVAVISWEPAITEAEVRAGHVLQAPNPLEFVRIKGPPGEHELVVTFESQAPRYGDAMPSGFRPGRP